MRTPARSPGGGSTLRQLALIVAGGVALELVTLTSTRPSGFLAFMVVGAVTLLAGGIAFVRLRRP